MSGPSFDDTLDYWVSNPDEAAVVSTNCMVCGLQSDDVAEGAAHAISHTQHKRNCDCGPCQVVYGDAGRTVRGYSARLVFADATDVWLSGEHAA